MTEEPMSISSLISGLLTLFLASTAFANAQCNADRAWAFMAQVHTTPWSPAEQLEEDGTEGPISISHFKTQFGLTRTDNKGCASHYCATSIALNGNEQTGEMFFIEWGGANFPDANEQSVAFFDGASGDVCVILHQGGDMFQASILDTVRLLRRER